MEATTNWAKLWRELVEIKSTPPHRRQDAGEEQDVWRERARDFDARVKRRWARPDSTREFVLGQLDSEATVLDIGAGTGAWACLLAQHVRHVTAVEPSAAMIEVLCENVEASRCHNVEVVQGAWPDVDVGEHDFVLCSHAMYTSPDLPAFIWHMIAVTRRMCFLVLRVPAPDNVLSQAARHIWGQPYDGPNFIIAYNILQQMGICPNVLMENTGVWPGETNDSLEEALAQTKRHFRLDGESRYDAYLTELLREHLSFGDGKYTWPPNVRSALVYWPIDLLSAAAAAAYERKAHGALSLGIGER